MAVLLILAIAFVLSLILLGITLASAARKARGPRLVVCPETITPELVRLDGARVAWTSLSSEPELSIRSCTRQRRSLSCGKDCLSQIESAEDGCRVEDRLARWQFGAVAPTREKSLSRRRSEPIEMLDHALAGDLAGDSPLAAVRARR